MTWGLVRNGPHIRQKPRASLCRSRIRVRGKRGLRLQQYCAMCGIPKPTPHPLVCKPELGGGSRPGLSQESRGGGPQPGCQVGSILTSRDLTTPGGAQKWLPSSPTKLPARYARVLLREWKGSQQTRSCQLPGMSSSRAKGTFLNTSSGTSSLRNPSQASPNAFFWSMGVAHFAVSISWRSGGGPPSEPSWIHT